MLLSYGCIRKPGVSSRHSLTPARLRRFGIGPGFIWRRSAINVAMSPRPRMRSRACTVHYRGTSKTSGSYCTPFYFCVASNIHKLLRCCGGRPAVPGGPPSDTTTWCGADTSGRARRRCGVARRDRSRSRARRGAHGAAGQGQRRARVILSCKATLRRGPNPISSGCVSTVCCPIRPCLVWGGRTRHSTSMNGRWCRG